MAKVPKVLGDAAPKLSGTAFYTNGTGAKVDRPIYTFPKRDAEDKVAKDVVAKEVAKENGATDR